MNSVEAGLTLNGHLLNNLRFAGDVDLVTESSYQLWALTDTVHDSSQRFRLRINVGLQTGRQWPMESNIKNL